MAVLNRTSQKTDVTGNITSNNNKEITALVMRGVLDNFIDSAKFRKNDLPIPGGTTGGTGNAYTLSISDDYPATLTTNFLVLVYTDRANTGDATLNINSIGATTWRRSDGSQYLSGEIKANEYHLVLYNGSQFRTIIKQGSSELAMIESTSTTLTLNVNTTYRFSGSGNATWTLPAGSASNVNQPIQVFNDTNFEITINQTGGDTITSFFGGIVYPGSYYSFIWTGTKWIMI